MKMIRSTSRTSMSGVTFIVAEILRDPPTFMDMVAIRARPAGVR
jgi:hypothetical protein